MSLVNILNINVLNNPAPFNSPLEFEITFECNAELKDDLEWRMVYVGSASSQEYDQLLDSIMVGPIPVGVNKFVFSAPPPNIEQLPQNDLLEVTVVFLSCLYNDKEFVRVGYYVNNEYIDEALAQDPPAQVMLDKLQRNILADKPKVTRYTIDWANPQQNPLLQTAATVQTNDQNMMVQ
ncbi:histone chaperone [Dichotomocladium elegans]|nr:histone chaperone [Dichotomocladium elegans]